MADKGYADGKAFRAGGILGNGYHNRSLSAHDKARNARYIPIRAPVERIFADLKQHRGLRWMRYVDRAKGQLRLTLPWRTASTRRARAASSSKGGSDAPGVLLNSEELQDCMEKTLHNLPDNPRLALGARL